MAPHLNDASLPTKPFELTEGKPGAFSLRTERYRYTIWKNKKGKTTASMLYDLQVDPQEFINLSDNQKHEVVIAELETLMNQLIEGDQN